MNKPTYSDTEGNRYTTTQIEWRIKRAALLILDLQFIEFGYNFCQECKENNDKPIDVSHTISRKKAKEDGCVEILWDIDNLEILGRQCHKRKDRLTIGYEN